MIDDKNGQWQLDDNEYCTLQIVIDCQGKDKAELYNRSLEFFINNFSDVNSAILERNIPDGIIIGRGVYKKVRIVISDLRNSVVDTWYLLKVEVRDGRAKITLSLTQYDESVRGSEPPDIHYLYPVSKQYPFNPAGYQKDLYEQALKISKSRAVVTIASAESALLGESMQNKNDNW